MDMRIDSTVCLNRMDMKNHLFQIFIILTFTLSLSACKSREKVVYLQSNQDEWEVIDTANYCLKIKPGDELSIVVSSRHPELCAPFNMSTTLDVYETNSKKELIIGVGKKYTNSFFVDPQGNIYYPYLGTFHLESLTKYQVQDSIQRFLRNNGYVSDAIVHVDISNLHYTVLGEVETPGIQKFSGDRLTIFNALASVSDMSIYGERSNVKILRQDKNTTTVKAIDLRDPALFTSPYYFVEQNDIIYVEPNHGKAQNRDMSNLNSFSIRITNLLLSIANLFVSL